MYNTPNLSTMGFSAAAIPLTLTNMLLQLAAGFVLVASYILLSRRSVGLRTRDFSLSARQHDDAQQLVINNGEVSSHDRDR
jgi:hypothetical protein